MTGLLRSTWYTLDRLMRAFVRTPFWIVVYLIQPLIWLLLFTQIFQSITVLPGFSTSSYVQFFAPGLIVTLAVFNSNFSGFQILSDISWGVLEKMLVTPVNRYGLIFGSLLYVAVTGIAQIVIGTSYLSVAGRKRGNWGGRRAYYVCHRKSAVDGYHRSAHRAGSAR